MSKSYSIGDAMSMYYESEFLTIDEVTLPQFSAKHNRRIKKTFKVFAKGRGKIYCQSVMNEVKKSLSIRKRIILVAIIIVFLALVTGCVIAFISNSFRGTVYNDNTHIFAFDVYDSPNTIEDAYTLSVLPEGYELYETIAGISNVTTIYRNSANQELVFKQTVKNAFNPHLNTEGYDISEVDIMGCDAICVEYARKTGSSSLIVWNNNKYILELHGNLAKEELMFLANSNEIEGF